MHPFQTEIHVRTEVEQRRRDAEQRRLLAAGLPPRRGLRRRPRPTDTGRA